MFKLCRCSTLPVIAAILAALCLTSAQARPDGAICELSDPRTETSKQWLNADGSRTVEIFSGPVHYKDADVSWQEIDLTFVPSADGGCSITKSPTKVHLVGTQEP